MDAAHWHGIVSWIVANALWLTGTASFAVTSSALAAALLLRRRRRTRDADRVADLAAAPQPKPTTAVAPAEPAAAPRLRDRLRRTSDALVGGLGKFLGASCCCTRISV
jgi:hypothetical protein